MPSISADGTRVSFPSEADLTGANGDGTARSFSGVFGRSVVVAGCDSGVPNVPLAGVGHDHGRNFLPARLVPGNHGDFVSCVSHLTNGLKASGIITGAWKGDPRCAASEAWLAIVALPARCSG